MTQVYPDSDWERAHPGAVGMDESLLEEARTELETASPTNDPRHLDRFEAANPYRVLVVKSGKLVAEWHNGLSPETHVPMASATKSVLSTMLGIAIEEGMVESANHKLSELFPEALRVLPGEGPKDGRHARQKDREITLKQLVANTSGYLKPEELPGEVKHYQTYGMNVLAHAIARAYNMYDSTDVENSPGLFLLIDTRLRIPLQGRWTYRYVNFDYPESAKQEVFGNFPDLKATGDDMARLGWLWCNHGIWKDEQIVPADWITEAVEPAPAKRENDPNMSMIDTYGLGFWTNRKGELWPSLPKDAFAAMGNGGIVIWVCPSLELVVVEGPGPFYRTELNTNLLPRIVNSVDTD